MSDSLPPHESPEALRKVVFAALERLVDDVGSWSIVRDDHIVMQLHRHVLTVAVDPLPGADGAMRLAAACEIVLANNLDGDRYLPLLARHLRREDPLAILALRGGRLISVRHHRIRTSPRLEDDIENLLGAFVIQAVQAELLVNEASIDGLLEPANDASTEPRGPDATGRTIAESRPNRLLDYAHRVAREGLRRMATTNLTGASKLGPWFEGTEQDELLESRMREGWQRTADPDRHVVVVRPPDSCDNIDSVQIAWAHPSPLMGPCLRLSVVTRRRLGPNPSRRLRSLNRPGDLGPFDARAGIWMPASWLDVDRLSVWSNGAWEPGRLDEASLADDLAAYVSFAPTAWARPGILARTWLWAEAEVERAFGTRILN